MFKSAQNAHDGEIMQDNETIELSSLQNKMKSLI